eukprot:1159211-Pelagomonas_calceolata.AAC.9
METWGSLLLHQCTQCTATPHLEGQEQRKYMPARLEERELHGIQLLPPTCDNIFLSQRRGACSSERHSISTQPSATEELPLRKHALVAHGFRPCLPAQTGQQAAPAPTPPPLACHGKEKCERLGANCGTKRRVPHHLPAWRRRKRARVQSEAQREECTAPAPAHLQLECHGRGGSVCVCVLLNLVVGREGGAAPAQAPPPLPTTLILQASGI